MIYQHQALETTYQIYLSLKDEFQIWLYQYFQKYFLQRSRKHRVPLIFRRKQAQVLFSASFMEK